MWLHAVPMLSLFMQAACMDSSIHGKDIAADEAEIISVAVGGVYASGTRAILFIGRRCGSLCGAWGYAFLHKERGRWIFDGHRVIGMS